VPKQLLSKKQYNYVYYMTMRNDHCFIVFSPKKIEAYTPLFSPSNSRDISAPVYTSGVYPQDVQYDVENQLYMDIFVNFSRTTSNLAISGMQSLERGYGDSLKVPRLDGLSKLSLSNMEESKVFFDNKADIIEIDGNNEYNTIFEILSQKRSGSDYLILYKMKLKQLWCFHLVGTGAIYLNKVNMRTIKGMAAQSKVNTVNNSKLNLPVESKGLSIKTTSMPRSLNLSQYQINSSIAKKKRPKRTTLLHVPSLNLDRVRPYRREENIVESESFRSPSQQNIGSSDEIVFMRAFKDDCFFVLQSSGLFAFLEILGKMPNQQMRPTKVGKIDLEADRISKIFSVLLKDNFLFISYEYLPQSRPNQAFMNYKFIYGIKTYKITSKREVVLMDDTLNYPRELNSKHVPNS
jgi:hypothetical protein